MIIAMEDTSYMWNGIGIDFVSTYALDEAAARQWTHRRITTFHSTLILRSY